MVRLGSIYTERCLMLTTHKRSLGQGNAFTPVCHFVHRGGVGFSACITGHMTRGDLHPGKGLHPGGLPPGEVSASGGYVSCYRPQICEGYVFTGVCLSTGGACVVARRGGMCGCSWGACMVALGGGMSGCSWGVCGCSGGHAWLLGGHAWLLGGGRHGFFDEIRSMSGRYASYWNAFLLKLFL